MTAWRRELKLVNEFTGLHETFVVEVDESRVWLDSPVADRHGQRYRQGYLPAEASSLGAALIEAAGRSRPVA